MPGQFLVWILIDLGIKVALLSLFIFKFIHILSFSPGPAFVSPLGSGVPTYLSRNMKTFLPRFIFIMELLVL